jgi:hypothetical protein
VEAVLASREGDREFKWEDESNILGLLGKDSCDSMVLVIGGAESS